MQKLKRLNAERLKHLASGKAKPGLYADGGNLYVQVQGGSAWLFRYERKADGKRAQRHLGLGPLNTVSADEARERARQCRLQLLAGIDPLDAKHAALAAVRLAACKATFAECARSWHNKQEATYKSEKHGRQVWSSLESVFPVLGSVAIDTVDTAAVVRALEPSWSRTPESASRTRGRIEKVLDAAVAANLRQPGVNPAAWSVLQHLLPNAKKLAEANGGEKHHAALPYAEAASFWSQLAAHDGTAADAFRFLILTAARTTEVREATWAEFDLVKRTWTVPAARAKTSADHLVPLSNAAIEILRRQPREGAFVFLSPVAKGKPLSDMVLWRLLRETMGMPWTPHGMRSTFSDWAYETTSHAPHAIELALSHRVGSDVEQAYRRGPMFAKRAKLMADWAAYLAKPVAADNVVSFAAAAKG